MCAIAGVLRLVRGTPPEGAVEGMLSQMMCRGPDGGGAFSSGDIELGHRRLTIIDSQGGAQPFFSEDGQVVVIFNGEIYNHRDLRRDLTAKGHHFHGYSDGEVISHLYEEYGAAFPQHLDGMFAIAVYDFVREELFLTRDRTGEKPLFYLFADSCLYFASTIRALLSVAPPRRRLSKQGLLGYFAHTQPAPPATLFEGVYKLLPAHLARIDVEGHLRLQPYWMLDCTQKTQTPIRDVIGALDEVLGHSVELMLQADYPIGLTLSGGIDSSLVLTYAHRHIGNRLSCFSLGAAGPADEEFERAATVAASYGISPHRFTVTKTRWQDMVSAMRCFDEPVNVYDSVYLLHHSAAIAESHRVVLTGNGADEAFGGYEGYLHFLRNVSCKRSEKHVLDGLLTSMLQGFIQEDIRLLYDSNMTRFGIDYDVQGHLSPLLALANYDDPVDARLLYDMFFGMAHSASLTDVVGMAYGVEYRSPFLARQVIEFAAALPTQWKVDMAGPIRTKVALRTLAASRLPEPIASAPKLGCGHFVDRFELMRTEWRTDIEDSLRRNSDVLLGYISYDKATALWRSFVAGAVRGNDQRRVLKLAMLLAWLDAWQDSLA